jgi:hypothetical protein
MWTIISEFQHLIFGMDTSYLTLEIKTKKQMRSEIENYQKEDYEPYSL